MILYKKLSDRILGMAFEVHKYYGPGLFEAAYEDAMEIEFELAGIPFERQKPYQLYYKGRKGRQYIADLVVDNKIILELKAVKELTSLMNAQIIHYMRISGIQVGYLINFCAEKVQWRRFLNR